MTSPARVEARRVRLKLLVLLALAVALPLVAAASLATGPLPVSLGQVAAALGFGDAAALQDFQSTAILELRLPRLTLALIIGAALAVSGATMQGIFRNPLAEPGLAGVSGGAALAAVAAIVLGGTTGAVGGLPPALTLPLAAFAGAALAAWLVARLARVDGHTGVGTLLLAGLAVNAVTGAGVGFLAQVADDVALRSLMFWMFGSLGKAGWGEIAICAPLMLLAIGVMLRDARALDALLLGEASAGHLGVDVEGLKRRQLAMIVLAVGSAVSLAGIIGFVGLVTPHLIRLWAGPGHRYLMPASALLGALLLALADLFARTWLAPAELPIGILTTLIGGPFFLALLATYRRRVDLP